MEWNTQVKGSLLDEGTTQEYVVSALKDLTILLERQDKHGKVNVR